MTENTTVRNEKIKDYYLQILNAFGEVLRQLMLDAVEDEFEQYWQALYTNSVRLTEKRNSLDHFFIAIQQHKNLKNAPGDKEQKCVYMERIFAISKEWPAQERIGIFDASQFLKQLQFVGYVRNVFGKRYKIAGEDVAAYAEKCREIRNGTEHFDLSDPNGLLSVDGLNAFYKNCRQLTSVCRQEHKVSKRARILYLEFVRQSDDLIRRAGYPPIDAAVLAAEYGFDTEKVLSICRQQNIAYSYYGGETPYILSISKEQLMETLNASETRRKLQQIAAIINAPDSTAPSRQEPALSGQIATARPAGQRLPVALRWLSHYQRGYLSDAEQTELFSRYNFIADASAFLSDSARRFVLYTLIPERQRLVPKTVPLFMLRSDRNKINDYANMEINDDASRPDYDEEENRAAHQLRDEARKAIHIIRMLRENRTLKLVGIPSYDLSPTQLLVQRLEEYRRNRFCVLTQSALVAEEIADAGIPTASAVKVVSGGKLLAWSVTAKNFSADHLQFVQSLDSNTPQESVSAPVETASAAVSEPAEPVAKAPVRQAAATPQKAAPSSEQEVPVNVMKARRKEENSHPIHTVHAGDTVYYQDGSPAVLKKELGSGGEGAVFELENPDLVAKIYYEKRKTATLESKLELMVTKTVPSKRIAWPQAILYDKNGYFTGFVMKRVPTYFKQLGETALMINNEAVRERFLKQWQRRDLVELCLAIVSEFRRLHKAGVMMGDINPANILINPDNAHEVFFVDCDSYQIGEYLCTVGTPIFTSPSYYERCNRKPDYSKVARDMDDERYAIATLLFEILMNGQAPFASKSTEKTDIIADICSHRFSFRTKENSGADVPDGPYRMIWNNMHFQCKSNFESVFVKGETVDEERWQNALNRYHKDITKGNYSNELFPKKYMGKDFVDFQCACCHENANMHQATYNDLCERFSQPIFLCNECKALMRTVIHDEKVQCSHCGKLFYADYGRIWRNREFGYNIKCDECSKKGR